MALPKVWIRSLVAALALAGLSTTALAFEDDDCLRVELTTQKATLDVLPAETIDGVRARAVDQVSRDAVYQVIGGAVDSSRGDETVLNNEQVRTHFEEVAHKSYAGLVRIKVGSQGRIGVEGRQFELFADVSVCVPKPATVVALEKQRAEKLKEPPHLVDPTKVSWFDPVSGAAQLWYWEGPDQTYKFFDKTGFDPDTGDTLKPADRDFAKMWRALQVKKQKDAEAGVVAQQQETERKRTAELAAAQAADKKEEQRAHAREACDRTAANPNDPAKPSDVAGTTWDGLKAVAGEAVAACEAAVAQWPAEPRYRYQLARAYSADAPKRALPLLKLLMAQHYVAAFDNFGWLLLDRRVGLNDVPGAVRAFRLGMKAGDPDAMTSLATFMLRGKADEAYEGEAMKLLQRAAQLGNQDAAAAIQRLAAEQQAAQQQEQVVQARRAQEREQQEQAARMFMGLMGGVIGNAGRR